MLFTVIIVLIILSISKNDPSLLIAILKIGAGIAAFIIIGTLLSNPIVVGCIVVFSIISLLWYFIKPKRNTDSKTNVGIMESKVKKESSFIVDDNSLSGFKSELNLNSKTPEQIIESEKRESIELAIKNAKLDYDDVKHNLLENAKNAKYEIINSKRTVSIKYHTYSLSRCLNVHEENSFINKSILYPRGQYTHITTYYINDYNYYNQYLLEIKKLLKNDDINCSPILYCEKNSDCPIIQDIPHRTLGTYFTYDLVLDCNVSY